MKKSALTIFSTALFVPALTLAQQPDFRYANDVVDQGIGWLQTSISVIMVLITIFFLYSVLRYVMEKKPDNLPDRRKTMLAGIVGLFVAVSVWGIIRIFQGTTGTAGYNSQSVQITCPPGQRAINGICVP